MFNFNKNRKAWLITINNEKLSLKDLSKFIESLEHFKYAIFQREKGEYFQVSHIQLFIIFSCEKDFTFIRKYFPKAHIEGANGFYSQCRDYCSKIDTRIEGPVELGKFIER